MIPDLDKLEMVCRDNGESVWRYDPEGEIYFRVYPNKKYSFILSKYLPNPQSIWDERIGKAVRVGGRVDIESMKPTPATYALWQHKIDIEKCDRKY